MPSASGAESRMQYTPVYWRTIDAIAKTERFVSSRGGTRSGKTCSNLQIIYQLSLLDKRPTITSVVSETFPHLKRGAIRDFQNTLGDLWEDTCWSKSESIYELHNGSIIEFFSADAPAKVHGPARDRLFLNEIQNIPFEIARQLFVRTKGLILMDYNPTASFWGNEKIEPRPDCVTINSTYLDNTFLTPEQVREIEANKGDENWWKVYGLGEFGTLDGVIYSFDLVDKMPQVEGKLVEVLGLDFGFTNDPTAIVRVVADPRKKEAWCEELCYERAMLNRHIAQRLRERAITNRIPIYADSAEPKSIAEIREAGFNIQPCVKDAPVRSDKLKFQIQWLQGWTLHFTKESLNLINEGRNYVWMKDMNGNPLNVPIDTFNHALDALRYALYTRFGQNAGYGQYHITIR